MTGLLIDIGNTRLKWGVDTREGFRFGGVADSSVATIEPLFRRDWASLDPDYVLLSCVGQADIEQHIIETAHSLWGIRGESLVSPPRACGLTNAYAQPATLGSDRWAAMVAAFQEVKGPVCVVSCGTALTLDAVDGNGQHCGGLILPGFRLQQQCLLKGTQLTFERNPAPSGVTALGRSTEQCIQYGTALAVSCVVTDTFTRLQQDHPGIQLILTGGDARILRDQLSFDSRLMPHLVLQGLALIHRGPAGSDL